MKIVVTGTHFTPAQAVIEELQTHPHVEVVYLGRRFTREGDTSPSAESLVLPGLGVKFIPLTAGRLQRVFTVHTIPSLLKIPLGFLQAFFILLKEKPDVVLSFGGYIGVPVVISAWLLSIPVIIHEQTLVTGLANEISSLFATKIAVSFKNDQEKDRRIILTGNPLRKAVIEIRENPGKEKISPDIASVIQTSQKESKPLIYITGGNQGSHIINQACLQILEDLTSEACIIHQAGDSKYNDFEKLASKQELLSHGSRYVVKKWVETEDVAAILKEADLVVSRGGINTIYELSYFSIPALVIPLPFIYKDEQTTNAHYFAKLGLAQVLLQKDLTAPKLYQSIIKMLKNLPQLKKQAQNARSVVIFDAAKRLALETLLLARKSD